MRFCDEPELQPTRVNDDDDNWQVGPDAYAALDDISRLDD